MKELFAGNGTAAEENEMSDVELDFRDFLRTKNETQAKRKSDRTRERLKLAAARCLSETGYRELKVTDITEEAGSSSGTFYIYFENKIEISRVVLEEFLAHLDEILSGDTASATIFGSLRQTNIRWLRYVRANAGLFRCMFQVADESPEISEIVHRLNRDWYQRISKSVLRRFSDVRPPDGNMLLLTVYSLGSMMDEIARRLIIYPDDNFVGLVRETTTTDEQFADFLSVVWFRTLYGRSPDEPLSEAPLALSRLILE